jgi:hypothetical protein
MEDSEKMYVVKLDTFSLTPCEKGLPMKHMIFYNEEIGKKVAEELKARGMNIEIHDGGKIVCVDADLPRRRVENATLSIIRKMYVV